MLVNILSEAIDSMELSKRMTDELIMDLEDIIDSRVFEEYPIVDFRTNSIQVLAIVPKTYNRYGKSDYELQIIGRREMEEKEGIELVTIEQMQEEL